MGRRRQVRPGQRAMGATSGRAGGRAHPECVPALAACSRTAPADHRPIKTRSAEAQRYFDQGLTLVYGFNHEEAIRSFRRAAALDPAAPMPLWGVAIALGENINSPIDPDRARQAWEALRQAEQLAANGSPVEQAY